MKVDVLAVTDEVDNRIYSETIRDRMGDVDLVVSCGDVPASYLEFLTDALRKSVYYVLGNHAEEITRVGVRGEPRRPEGCTDLGFTTVRDPVTGLLMAGLPGSPRYSDQDPVQFTERQMRWRIYRMTPWLLLNRIRYGRYLDVLVTHSPPRDMGDRDDPAHRGFQAIRWLIGWAQPRYHLHGHIHILDRSRQCEFRLGRTEIINVYPYRRLELDIPELDGLRNVGSGAAASEVDRESVAEREVVR